MKTEIPINKHCADWIYNVIMFEHMSIKFPFSCIAIACLTLILYMQDNVQAATKVSQKKINSKPVIQTSIATSNLAYEPGKLLVKLKAPLQLSSSNKKTIQINGITMSTLPASIQKANKLYGLTAISKVVPKSKNKEFDKWYVLSFKNQDAKAIAATLRNQSDIQYVNLNYKIEFFAEDPQFSQQWHLHNQVADTDIDGIEAFDLSAYGVTPKNKSVNISVVDQPLFANHSDLKDSVWVNSKEIPNDGKDNDANGYIDDVNGCFFGYINEGTYNCATLAGPPTILDHGTQVAGVIGATHNNGIGIKGVCPHCKVLRAGVPYFYINVLEAISYSVDNGAKVINMSWGFNGTAEDTQALQEVFEYAHNAGVTLVAANGNNGSTFMFKPANMNYVIGVASLNRDNKKASSSTYGELTDISAPGQDILTTHHSSRYGTAHNTYIEVSGTSFASAVVTATVGMLLSYSPELNPNQIETIIKETVDPITYTSEAQVGKLGAGRINMFRALYKSLNLKDVFKDMAIASVQCHGNKTRLELRDKKGIIVDGKPAKHIIDNIYSHWVENGKKITITGTSWSTNFTVPNTCKVSQLPAAF